MRSWLDIPKFGFVLVRDLALSLIGDGGGKADRVLGIDSHPCRLKWRLTKFDF